MPRAVGRGIWPTHSESYSPIQCHGWNNNNSPQSITADSLSQFRNGWTFGTGVEHAFAQNWSAFAEDDYLDFGTSSANTTHIFSQPNNVPASFVIPIVATSTERFNIVKVGLNYRFNWWGGP
jgi:outer membrane immunogenic protein